MPLEIRELIIRTRIVSGEDQVGERTAGEYLPLDMQRLVEQCTEKVLKALRKKIER